MDIDVPMKEKRWRAIAKLILERIELKEDKNGKGKGRVIDDGGISRADFSRKMRKSGFRKGDVYRVRRDLLDRGVLSIKGGKYERTKCQYFINRDEMLMYVSLLRDGRSPAFGAKMISRATRAASATPTSSDVLSTSFHLGEAPEFWELSYDLLFQRQPYSPDVRELLLESLLTHLDHLKRHGESFPMFLRRVRFAKHKGIAEDITDHDQWVASASRLLDKTSLYTDFKNAFSLILDILQYLCDSKEQFLETVKHIYLARDSGDDSVMYILRERLQHLYEIQELRAVIAGWLKDARGKKIRRIEALLDTIP